MQKELALFRELFSAFPNIAILHINNNVEFISSTVEQIAKEYEGKINFISFHKDSFKLKVPAREYEYAILSDLFEEFNLITAKKMHMWGNGL